MLRQRKRKLEGVRKAVWFGDLLVVGVLMCTRYKYIRNTSLWAKSLVKSSCLIAHHILAVKDGQVDCMRQSYAMLNLRGLDKLNRLFTTVYKGNNFCDFLFAFLHITPLLKIGLLWKERIGSSEEHFFPFRFDHFSEGRKAKPFWQSCLPCTYIHSP